MYIISDVLVHYLILTVTFLRIKHNTYTDTLEVEFENVPVRDIISCTVIKNNYHANKKWVIIVKK